MARTETPNIPCSVGAGLLLLRLTGALLRQEFVNRQHEHDVTFGSSLFDAAVVNIWERLLGLLHPPHGHPVAVASAETRRIQDVCMF